MTPTLISLTFTLTVPIALTLILSSTSAFACTPLSLCLAVDESGSITDEEFSQQTTSLSTLTTTLTSKAAPAHPHTFSAVGFSDTAHIIHKPTTDTPHFNHALTTNTQAVGRTSVGAALFLCAEILRNDTVGDGGGADVGRRRAVLFVTDGRDNVLPVAGEVAAGVRAEGVEIFGVGVGGDVNGTALGGVVSGRAYLTLVDDFQAFEAIVPWLALSLCPPLPSLSPGASATPLPSPTTLPTPPQSPLPSPTTLPTPTASRRPRGGAKKSRRPSPSPMPSPSGSWGGGGKMTCVAMVCARCGGRLHCFVDSGDEAVDAAVCRVTRRGDVFCGSGCGGGGAGSHAAFTACGQHCPISPHKREGGGSGGDDDGVGGLHDERMARCFKGERLSSSMNNTGTDATTRFPTCAVRGKGGRVVRRAHMLNVATYGVCIRDGGVVQVHCRLRQCVDGRRRYRCDNVLSV